MAEYKPTIGLEIHVELKTPNKMFCGCKNDPLEKKPNINVCPICLGHPGTLPTLNKEAIEAVLKVGVALKGELAKETHFDRKSYFYPDLPKGYQISQYDFPLVEGGELKGARIRRIHLEEDVARLLHEKNKSLIDFNRAGVPLMELVTEPDIMSAKQAVEFAGELQLILRYLDVSEANMELGQMRVEVNISLDMGTKVEVKNINSFRAVHDAIQYELKRQEEVLKNKEKLIQETRGWDEKKLITVSQRSKESAHDYRYFPEPDLPPLNISKIWNEDDIKRHMPELPEAKRKRFETEYGITSKVLETIIGDKKFADFFEAVVSELKTKIESPNCKLTANYLTSDLRGLMVGDVDMSSLKFTPENFAHLIFLIQKGELSSRLAKDLLLKMYTTGEDPEVLIREGGMAVVSDEGELNKIIETIIQENPKVVEEYKKGKTNSLQFLIGQGMAKSKGKANPQKLKELFEKSLFLHT